MNRNKFEYFLNAVLYCLWLRDKKREDSIGKIVETILSPIPNLFFTKKHKKKYYEQYLPEANAKLDKFYHDKKTGFNIHWAKVNLDCIYSGYPLFISFCLAGLVLGFQGPAINKFYLMLLVAIPIIPCYILVDKMVFTNSRYLKYFKKFEKEDEAWHKKWKRRTMLFSIGSIIVTLLGIAAAFAIAILIP